jgi:hypothetical protein
VKRAIAAFVVSCVAALAPLSAQAQQSATVTSAFNFTAQNQQVTLPLNGQSWCSVAVAVTSATLVPSASTDNAIFSTVPSIGAGSITIAQTYSGNATGAGLNYFRLQQTTAGASSGTITCTSAAAAVPSGVGSNGPGMYAVCDQSAAVNIAAAGTTSIVTGVVGKTIFPCAFTVTVAGTAPTIQFESGTTANCGSNTTVLSGTYLPLATSTFALGGGVGVFVRLPSTPALGLNLCVIAGGTTPSIQGIITYALVQ